MTVAGDLPPERDRHQLRAEAEAEYGLVGIERREDVSVLPREPRVFVLHLSIHVAAEDGEEIVCGHIRWKFAREEARVRDLGVPFGEEGLEGAEPFVGDVLKDAETERHERRV